MTAYIDKTRIRLLMVGLRPLTLDYLNALIKVVISLLDRVGINLATVEESLEGSIASI